MATRSVIVVGAGIAGLSAAHHLAGRGGDVLVLEAAHGVGGRMSSDRRDGYVIDRGAQFLSRAYSVVGQLIRDAGLAPHLQRVSGWSAIMRRGRLRRINARYPWTLATSGLLAWRDLLRLARRTRALERQTRKLPLHDYSEWHLLDDADAAAWIAGSFGRAALDYAFEPMLEGFYFQAPEGMSRALAALVWSMGGRGGGVEALDGGMGTLPRALACGLSVVLGTAVQSIEQRGSGVRVRTAAGAFEAEYLVLATTAPVARALHEPASDVEARLLSTGYSASINVSLALHGEPPSLAAVAGVYGVLIPRAERRVIAAIALESRKCPAYVPRGELLNVMLCHAAAVRLMAAPDEQILAEVLPELDRCFPGIESHLAFAQISRWPEAEPRSPVGRSRALHEYRQSWRAHGRVVLAGDYMGIPCLEGAAESGRWAAMALAGDG